MSKTAPPLPTDTALPVTKVVSHADQEETYMYTVTLQDLTTLFIQEDGVLDQCQFVSYVNGEDRRTNYKGVFEARKVGKRTRRVQKWTEIECGTYHSGRENKEVTHSPKWTENICWGPQGTGSQSKKGK